MRRIALAVAPALIVSMYWGANIANYNGFAPLKFLVLATLVVIYAAFLVQGRLRNWTIAVASLLTGFSIIEAYFALSHDRILDRHTVGYSVSRPILGWGPKHPGVFQHFKRDVTTRTSIYDVQYSIDQNLNRRVISADSGPLIAFVGDSMTFGTGLPDAETLPQQFADIYHRRLGVMNLGFPGYGPQQFLRAIETSLYDKLLSGRVHLFVYETAAWHAERSSCAAGFMLRAPRYVIEQDQPKCDGTCYTNWAALPRELLANTAIYKALLGPLLGAPSRADIDLYVAIIVRAAKLAKERFDAPTLILYVRSEPGYLRRSGYSEDQIIQHLRDADVKVIDASLAEKDAPGLLLSIPGDGHPTGAANALRAAMIKRQIEADPDLRKHFSG